jgi:glutamate dehydrogenase/leucine dehydrogenase
MLSHHNNMSMEGMSVAISGSGNVAQYATEKVLDLGGKVLTLSDSGGTIYDKDGIDRDKLAYVMELKNVQRGRIEAYAKEYTSAEYLKGVKPWSVDCDIALPCATQNELDIEDAKALVKNGCKCVAEGANMPTTYDATEYLIENSVLFGPGKAANAGGVAVSGLEMSQNSTRLNWSREDVDSKLKGIMSSIHSQCVEHGETGNLTNYVRGANIAGFIKVADAMLDQGLV